jgi:hypothetical protein
MVNLSSTREVNYFNKEISLLTSIAVEKGQYRTVQLQTHNKKKRN